MKLKFNSPEIAACWVWQLMFLHSVASADPPDPHQPDVTRLLPGWPMGFGELAVCDGEVPRRLVLAPVDTETWFTGPGFTSIVSAA